MLKTECPMSETLEINPRAKQILYAVVTEFVATGEPVGSKTIAHKWGVDLSSATIRSVLMDLEAKGYLSQPHASAGRIPTDRAFRLFVDALMKVESVSASQQEQIETRIRNIRPGENVLRETGRLLSELSGAAVVVAPKPEKLTLSQLRFLRTKPGELLAVLILSNGSVQNRFLKVQLSDVQLDRIQSLLDDVTEGRTLGELKEFFSRKLSTEQVQNDELRLAAYTLGEGVVAEGTPDELFVEGQSRLLQQLPGDGVRLAVDAFDEREAIVRLLDATIVSTGTTVVVGQDAGVGGGHLSIIGASYMDHGRVAGSVAVIGPTRMDYPKVVPLVAATAQAISKYGAKRRDDE